MTCRDGTEATGGGASEPSARSLMGLKWPDHTTRTQIHSEGSNTRKQSCKDVASLPASLDTAFKHLHPPVRRYCCDKPHTSQVFFFFFPATPPLMVPVIFVSLESLHLCLKGVPASLNAAAGKDRLQVRLWVSLNIAWCAVTLCKCMHVKYIRCISKGRLLF